MASTYLLRIFKTSENLCNINTDFSKELLRGEYEYGRKFGKIKGEENELNYINKLERNNKKDKNPNIIRVINKINLTIEDQIRLRKLINKMNFNKKI